MKNLLILSSILFISFYSCSNKKIKPESNNVLQASLIDTVKPKVNYKVSKKYDKNGNLISEDSTYSYIYSNGNISDKIQSKIFKQFKNEMSQKFPDIQNDIFNNFFGSDNINDSIFKNNFYSPDYFFKNQNKQIKRMLKQMDSVKNNFYKSQIKTYKKQI